MTKYTPKISLKEIFTIIKLRLIQVYKEIRHDIKMKRMINGMAGLMDREINSTTKWPECAVPDTVATIRDVARARYMKQNDTEETND